MPSRLESLFRHLSKTVFPDKNRSVDFNAWMENFHRLPVESQFRYIFLDSLNLFRQTLDVNYPAIGVNEFIFSEEVSQRPVPSARRLIDEIPEGREYVKHFYTTLMETGMVFCRGRFLGPKGEYGPHTLLFGGGNGSIGNERAIRTIATHLPIEKLVEGLVDSSGFVAAHEEASGCFSYLLTQSQLLESFQFVDDPRDMDAVRDVVKSLVQKHPNDELMFFHHIFPSGSYRRGHPLCIKIDYVFPGKIGRELEQELANYPWIMEMLSELVVENAHEELGMTRAVQFQYFNLYRGNREKTRMFLPSVAKRFLLFASFYHKTLSHDARE